MTAPETEALAIEKPAENGAEPQPDHHTIEFDTGELMFLRAVLTVAQTGPAELKITCGQLQQKVEAIIGPMPTPG